MNEHDRIRKDVSEAYARAITGGGGCCTPNAPKGAAAKLAGYGASEVQGVPSDAASHSFGCGNPLAFGEVREGEVVLDLGSGAGLDLLIAARKVGPRGRVIGVDMTDEMIARARQNIAAAGLPNVAVRKGIIEALPVEDASVDWVISNCVINLSPEKNRVFAEIARVLKPGGRMLVSDIVVEDLPAWVRESAALYSSCVAGAISEREYVAGLRAAGLEQVEVRHRFAYQASQIEAIVESDLEQVASCCGSGGTAQAVRQAAQAVEGKVWSATFVARRHVASAVAWAGDDGVGGSQDRRQKPST